MKQQRTVCRLLLHYKKQLWQISNHSAAEKENIKRGGSVRKMI